MDKKVVNTIIALALVVGFFAGAVGGGIVNLIIFHAMRQGQGRYLYSGFTPYIPPHNGWYSSQPAAPNSVEAQLRAKGKTWVKTGGVPAVGDYVQDTLEGRSGQPRGRGAIGKVVAVSGPNDPPPPGAMVDFGRGYKTGINFSELSVVQVQP